MAVDEAGGPSPVPAARTAAGGGRPSDDVATSVRRYQVELIAIPGDETAFVKAMRLVGRLTLPEALDVFDGAQAGRVRVLVAGIGAAAADSAARILLAAGVAVCIERSPLHTPMVCRLRLDDVLAPRRPATLRSV